MNSFDAILLIDDDESTNFYHRLVIEDWGLSETIITVKNGHAALELLQADPRFPSYSAVLILLDMNMPIMGGFEFMEEYQKLPSALRATQSVIMLTSSIYPADEKRATNYPDIKAFYSKPLKKQDLNNVLAKIKANLNQENLS